ncbi:glycogen debranching protein GlgX [Rivibacter subsaxonicus]|uniref:Glycogen operon protein n=1 Tax=Rivibacter subsaxonicus TaxID=457575 RepID=A0A4Q7VB42_9BURK|nr:glycogen debranching protein GlgX [Rivibacter subsaxonicus]RZT91982.1 glycogen operon protein [Rivibacter subsaxonicus]
MSVRLEPGLPHPLGATPRDGGTNFALFAGHATRVELCLFDVGGTQEWARLELRQHEDGIWHGFLPELGAGLVYGWRVHGPFEPGAGHRHNPHKLLLDPCAREIVGRFEWREEHLGHADDPLQPDGRDNAAWALKARVAEALPPLRQPRPHTALAESVLYELHVKGFTKLMPGVPEPLRGSYAGLAHPAAIAHLRRLGVTAVSLLPVHYAISEERLGTLGLSNYWGYNTIGFFAADPRWSLTPDDPSATRAEFRAMVEALHAAGIEVLLDVVYNHTAEAGEQGPTIAFRGLDNASYYRLQPEDRALCENLTGCGNTLALHHPRVTQLVLDSLRYWAGEMGVDGFRFDLAPVLGRTAPGGPAAGGFDPQAAFFAALAQDPPLAGCKLIAEPWDAGPHGYQLGRFPGRWAEWNDRFRDANRLYWLTRGVTRGEFARRFAASDDFFHHGLRKPSASINFVAAHDGFTLLDTVSHNHRHNQANGEHNRDGHHANFSINCGVEGASAHPALNALRKQHVRTLLANTLLAHGTPMLLAGDEIGRTQRGNNNAYCQDNEIGWLDWARADEALIEVCARLVALRRELPALHQDRWLRGEEVERVDGERRPDAAWLHPDGREMSIEDWHELSQHAFALLLEPPPQAPQSATVLVLFNPAPAPTRFALPSEGRWQLRFDSGHERPLAGAVAVDTPAFELGPHSLALLCRSSS